MSSTVTVWPTGIEQAEQLRGRRLARAPRRRRRCVSSAVGDERPSATACGRAPTATPAWCRPPWWSSWCVPAVSCLRAGSAAGATAVMSGATVCSASAVASPVVSVEAEPKPPRTPLLLVVLPGETMSRLLPERVDLAADLPPARPRRDRRSGSRRRCRSGCRASSAPSAAGGCGSPRSPVRSVSTSSPRAASSRWPRRARSGRRGRGRPAARAAATSASWVISTMVRPASCSSSKQAEHVGAGARVEVAGRLVGQDQAGSVTSARATATRCCWPPDSSPGRCSTRSARPDPVQRGDGPAARSARATPA